MATVIDSLVVLLGLDASNYKKGREQAEKETAETSRKTRQAADAITKSLTDVGKTVASLFLGFESATGFAKWLGTLNSGEAALGRTAANIGMSAHELNKWGNAAALAGGSAQDVQGAFTQLTQDFQKMNATGEQSGLLQLLRARGVQIRDENGNLRNQGTILEELADKTAQYGRAYQATMFAQAGLSQGEINYLTQSKELRNDQLRLAEQNNSVTEDSVQKAQRLQEYWRNIGQQIEAAGQRILETVTPAIQEAFTWASNFMATFRGSGEFDRLAETFRDIGHVIAGIVHAIEWLANSGPLKALGTYTNFMLKQYGKVLDLFDPGKGAQQNAQGGASSPNTPQVAPDIGLGQYRNNNPGNLRPYKSGQATDARGFRTFGSTAEGIQALNDDIAAKLHRGLDTISKIVDVYAPAGDHNDTVAYKAALVRDTGKTTNEHLTDADRAAIVAGIIRHEDAALKPAKTAADVKPGVNVQIDQMHVHGSSDPKATADAVPAAIQRKLTVSQADTGQS